MLQNDKNRTPKKVFAPACKVIFGKELFTCGSTDKISQLWNEFVLEFNWYIC